MLSHYRHFRVIRRLKIVYYIFSELLKMIKRIYILCKDIFHEKCFTIWVFFRKVRRSKQVSWSNTFLSPYPSFPLCLHIFPPCLHFFTLLFDLLYSAHESPFIYQILNSYISLLFSSSVTVCSKDIIPSTSSFLLLFSRGSFPLLFVCWLRNS